MKLAQNLSELRSLDSVELNEHLKEARTELFNLRFQAATGQLENHRQIRMVRRRIAQVLTVIQGRSLGIEEIVAMPVPAVITAVPETSPTSAAASTEESESTEPLEPGSEPLPEAAAEEEAQ